jgi:chemotaxis protein CheD
MCHYMVPSRHPASRHDGTLDGRYADEAVQLILGSMRSVRTGPHEYVLKMFGGASQFPDWVPASDAAGLPERNVTVGLELLAGHGLQPSVRHVGGTGYRQILLELWTGDVWLKHGAGSSGAAPGHAREGQPA